MTIQGMRLSLHFYIRSTGFHRWKSWNFSGSASSFSSSDNEGSVKPTPVVEAALGMELVDAEEFPKLPQLPTHICVVVFYGGAPCRRFAKDHSLNKDFYPTNISLLPLTPDIAKDLHWSSKIPDFSGPSFHDSGQYLHGYTYINQEKYDSVNISEKSLNLTKR